MFSNYIIIALRNFRKNVLYAGINIVGLSVGIASAILILLYVQHELSADKHHEHYDELYRVGVRIGIGGPPVTAGLSSYPAGPNLAGHFPEITMFTRFFSLDLLFSDILVEYNEHGIYEKGILLADSNFFDLFTHQAVYGDPAASLRHNNVAVLTLSSAEKIFGPGNPVGKTFRLDQEHNIEVGAVIEDIPDNAHLKFRMLLFWNSLDNLLGSGLAGNSYFQNNLFTYIRADSDLNTPGFTDKVDDFVRDHVLTEFDEHGLDGSFQFLFRPLKDLYFLKDDLYEPANPEMIPTKGDRQFVYVFITIAIFLTSIASINYMNMAIARSTSRSKEVGVRKAMGADRPGLIRQFFTESLLTSFLALCLALLWVEVTLPYFNGLLMKNLSFNLAEDPQFSLWLLALAVFAGLLSGSYPALYLSGFNPAEVLKQQPNLSDRNLFTRKVLVGMQFTISVFMMIATLVVMQQLSFMRNKDMGYDRDNVLLINVSDLSTERRTSLRNEIEQLSIVKGTSMSENIPGPGSSLQQWGFSVETEYGFAERMTPVFMVDPHYAGILKLEMAEGRFFDPGKPTDLNTAYVINEAAVRLFEWDEPLGKQIRHIDQQADTSRRTVIGVVKDFHLAALDQKIAPLIIIPVENGNYVNVRLSDNAGGQSLQSVQQIWDDVAEGLPFRYQYMDERHQQAIASFENLGRLFALFAALCIFLSLMGLFGLSGFSAEQKTKEIGIRIVHGASLNHILVLLYREYVWLMLVAIMIASACSFYFLDNWLTQFAYRIGMDIVPFMGAAILAFAVSLITVGYHAIRITRDNPVEALKYE